MTQLVIVIAIVLIAVGWFGIKLYNTFLDKKGGLGACSDCELKNLCKKEDKP
ncbi:MAG: hypothetical protein M0P33_05585 [Massilibacteroides sp.]|nr:hypothetical protein [Massilibacteroides sp.]